VYLDFGQHDHHHSHSDSHNHNHHHHNHRDGWGTGPNVPLIIGGTLLGAAVGYGASRATHPAPPVIVQPVQPSYPYHQVPPSSIRIISQPPITVQPLWRRKLNSFIYFFFTLFVISLVVVFITTPMPEKKSITLTVQRQPSPLNPYAFFTKKISVDGG
jgi:hypothetical protein